jgi:NAD(P)-dependent dehydrogenase (short-subunit alcohol dehydrogenase family)
MRRIVLLLRQDFFPNPGSGDESWCATDDPPSPRDRAPGRIPAPRISTFWGVFTSKKCSHPAAIPAYAGQVSTSSPLLYALVTGASRGIGRAIARELAARGCRVAGHYQKNPAAAAETLGLLAGEGHALFSADLAAPAEVDRLWREVTAAFGRVDILVNNAGIYTEHAPLVTSTEGWQNEWRQTLAVNLHAPAQLCHLAANAMVAAGGGRIVNISSRGAYRGEPRAPAYGASKAGLNSLSQSLAVALAPRGVAVFGLAPGWVATDMAADYLEGPCAAEILEQHPLGRVATVEEIARAAVYCALDAPMAMTGAIVDVNGASYLR